VAPVRRLAAPLVALLACAVPVRAHDLARSESRVTVTGSRELHAAVTLNLLDFGSLADLDRNRDQTFSYDEVDRGIDRLYALVRDHFSVGGPQAAASTSLDRYELLDATAIRLDLTYRFAADVTAVRVRSSLGEVTGPDHVHVTVLDAGGERHQAMLAGDSREVTFALPGGVSFDRLLQIAIVAVALVGLVGYVLVRRVLLP
jgi:hypothetical protein